MNPGFLVVVAAFLLAACAGSEESPVDGHDGSGSNRIHLVLPGGLPAAGARLELRRSAELDTARMETVSALVADSAGMVYVYPADFDQRILVRSADGSLVAQFDLPAGSLWVDTLIALQSGASWDGWRISEGSLPQGSRVCLRGLPWCAWTDKDGHFLLSGVPAGSVDPVVLDGNLVWNAPPVLLASGASLRLPLGYGLSWTEAFSGTTALGYWDVDSGSEVQRDPGILRLVARRTSSGIMSGSTIHYLDLLPEQGGWLEIRARVPADTGMCYWARLSFSSCANCAVDVFLGLGHASGWWRAATWRMVDDDTVPEIMAVRFASDVSEGAHSWALQWDSDSLRWFLDGEQMHSRARDRLWNGASQLSLGLDSGGIGNFLKPGLLSSSALELEQVRFWQR